MWKGAHKRRNLMTNAFQFNRWQIYRIPSPFYRLCVLVRTSEKLPRQINNLTGECVCEREKKYRKLRKAFWSNTQSNLHSLHVPNIQLNGRYKNRILSIFGRKKKTDEKKFGDGISWWQFHFDEFYRLVNSEFHLYCTLAVINIRQFKVSECNARTSCEITDRAHKSSNWTIQQILCFIFDEAFVIQRKPQINLANVRYFRVLFSMCIIRV